jgi:predicted CXXCH cytochrome family protein
MMIFRVIDGIRNRLIRTALIGLLLFAGTSVAADVTDIYTQDVPEMTTIECAKCHLQVFETLRDAGGLHKQECRDCHDKFHTFTPGIPWEERVPSCASCHDYPHGEVMTACLECHKNSHAPIESLVVAEKLADMCERCHQAQGEELQQGDSAHSGQSCYDCHQGLQHGVRPKCNLCHEESHAPFVDNAGCASCHPPHVPNKVTYGSKIPNSMCGGCHADQLQVLQNSDRKHKSLACVICHANEHGQIADCQYCHDNGPHNSALLKNFDSCNDCHGDPHRLKL